MGDIGAMSYFSVAGGKFLGQFLGMDDRLASVILILLTLIYTVASGFYGGVITDLFQGFLIFVAANSSNGTTNNSNGATTQNPGVVPKTVVVARRLIQRGAILQPDMLEEVQASPGNADTQLLSSLKDAQNAELTRDIAAGQALRISDIRRAVMVKQGQSVMFSVGNGKEFQISIRMEAMQDGRLGEQVRLKNPESGRQVSGVVTGLNSAKGL